MYVLLQFEKFQDDSVLFSIFQTIDVYTIELAMLSLMPQTDELNNAIKRDAWMSRVEQYQDLFDRVLVEGNEREETCFGFYGKLCCNKIAELRYSNLWYFGD